MVGVQRWLRAYGLTQHPNVLGGLLMAGLLVVIGFYLIQLGSRRIALLAMLAVGLGTLLLTFSRAAWLGTAAGGLAMLGVLLWAQRQGARPVRRSSLVLLGSLILAVVLVFVAANWPLLRPRLGLASQGVEIRSVEERVMLDRAALVLIQMRPWFGVGLGSFPAALFRLVPEAVSSYPSFTPVHNIFLLATAELGFLGGLLWLCLILSPWLALWLRRRQVEMTPWWAGLSGAMAALTVVSFFDHYLWSFQQGRLMLWLVWGLWAREWARLPFSRRMRESTQEPSP
jgi:O-antigen ligase